MPRPHVLTSVEKLILLDDIGKKFLQALVGRKKLHAAQMKYKNILALLQARKKNVAKLFHHSWGALQNPCKTATIPDNLQASEPLVSPSK